MYTLLLLAAAAAVVAVTWGFLVFRLAGGGDDTYGMCAPARYEPLTARPADAPLRIVAELAPPAGWRDVPLHVAIVPAPAAVAHDDGDPDELDDWGDEPWLVAEDWPQRQVAAVEPVPLVVNRTAARFSALEFNGRGNHG